MIVQLQGESFIVETRWIFSFKFIVLSCIWAEKVLFNHTNTSDGKIIM